MESPAISGRLAAAAMNLLTLLARKATSRPARSSSTKVKPPAVPTPGMDGGEKANARPSGILDSSRFRRARIASKCSASLVRSDHGLKFTKKKALYVL